MANSFSSASPVASSSSSHPREPPSSKTDTPHDPCDYGNIPIGKICKRLNRWAKRSHSSLLDERKLNILRKHVAISDKLIEDPSITLPHNTNTYMTADQRSEMFFSVSDPGHYNDSFDFFGHYKPHKYQTYDTYECISAGAWIFPMRFHEKEPNYSKYEWTGNNNSSPAVFDFPTFCIDFLSSANSAMI